MFLNFGALGVLSHKWVMLLLPVLLLTLIYRDKQDSVISYSSLYRLFIFCVIIITVILIWVALY